MITRPFPLVAVLAAIALAGCDPAPGVRVSDAVVRLPAVPGRPGAAYFTLEATTIPMRLLGVASPQIERIELHQSSMIGGVMRMGPLEETRFDDSKRMLFAPGGHHAMLFGIDPAVKAGGTVRLTFDFDAAPDVTVEARVEGAGDP